MLYPWSRSGSHITQRGSSRQENCLLTVDIQTFLEVSNHLLVSSYSVQYRRLTFWITYRCSAQHKTTVDCVPSPAQSQSDRAEPNTDPEWLCRAHHRPAVTVCRAQRRVTVTALSQCFLVCWPVIHVVRAISPTMFSDNFIKNWFFFQFSKRQRNSLW